MTADSRTWTVRPYESSDEAAWLRCRVLGFLDTSYFDDVVVSRPRPERAVELVAVGTGTVVGLCDASVIGQESTIETIAVHPDFRRRGIAHALLRETAQRLRALGAGTLEAWTREDPGTLAWYRAEGFLPRFRYLHVYASTPEEMAVAVDPEPGLMPRNGHFHAWESEEESLRLRFSRVHGCHQMVRPL